MKRVPTLPRLRISRSASTKVTEIFEISEPIKSVRKSPKDDSKKVFEPVRDPMTYFAFQVKDAFRLMEEANPIKLTHFMKKLESINCERIFDDEIDLEKKDHIIVRGPYSKLFEIFNLIKYINVFDINAIKMQFLMKNRNNEMLIVLPLVKEEEKTFESDNSVFHKMFSPRTEQKYSENESKLREKLEEEDFQRRVDELEKKHRTWMEENGLIKPEIKSPKTKMREAIEDLTKNLVKRGETLEQVVDETEKLEYNTAEFAQKSRNIRVHFEGKLT